MSCGQTKHGFRDQNCQNFKNQIRVCDDALAHQTEGVRPPIKFQNLELRGISRIAIVCAKFVWSFFARFHGCLVRVGGMGVQKNEDVSTIDTWHTGS